MSSTRTTYRSSFSQSLSTGIALGAIGTGCFYAMILTGPLNYPLLRRYCFGHWSMGACIAIFSIAFALLSLKLWHALTQLRLTQATVSALASLIADGCQTVPAERPRWLEASWLSLPLSWQRSWFGLRLNQILTLQLRRGRRDALEHDLRSLSEADLRRQRASYSPMRIATCALPLLGVLGTVLAFSELNYSDAAQHNTQGSTTVQATINAPFFNTSTSSDLASSPSDALPSSASRMSLDALVTALTLTLATLLAQFIVNRHEMELLERIDHGVQDTLIEFLAADPHDAEESLFAPVNQMTADLIEVVHQIVEQQANIWSRSISESQRQWSNWTQAASECIASNLTDTISAALKNHAGRLEKIQEEGSRQIDTRWQQWQTTLSDQARAMSSQQKELIRQTDSIQQLVSATTELRKLEETIQESVGRLENINRLEDASQCVGEAVAVLATSLERAGIIRGAPVRPRVVRKADSPADDETRRKAA